MLASAAVGGQYVASRAARDAFFLTNFEASALPAMIIVTALVSIGLVVAGSRVFGRLAPGSWVPVAFASTAVLMLGIWALGTAAPRLAAQTLYLSVSGVGPILASGFWLISSERFDPHTAKRVFGKIAGAGTLGGLLGGLGAAGAAAIGDVGAMLPLLAALNLGCAWSTRTLSRSAGAPPLVHDRSGAAPLAPSGLRVLADTRYLRDLAALVLLGTIAETFVDQVFKTQVQAAYGSGASLGGFFSLYYAALSVITFIVQTTGSRYVLEKLGLAAAAGAPALMFLLGGAATLLVPGLRNVILTRAGEAVVRGSIYRSAYELFYTPIAPVDKRAVKSIIDVGVDRTGDILGATLTQQLVRIPQPNQTTALLALGMACAGIGLLVASRLTRGYASALEKRLLDRAVELDLSKIEDRTTRATLLRTLQQSQPAALRPVSARSGSSARQEPPPPPGRTDPEVEAILILRSRDHDRVGRELRRAGGPSAAVVPHVIPLLAEDAVSDDAIYALRTVAEEHVGELVDALMDPNQPFAVRRRLARVFSVCVSQRAADGLMLGLEDLRFEVRYQCGQSLLAIVEKNPAVRIDRARLFALVHKEVAVSKDVWEKRRLLDTTGEGDHRSFLEELVRGRANQSLAHVFTLLALVLPTKPLRLAFGPCTPTIRAYGAPPWSTWRPRFRTTFAIDCGDSSKTRARPARFRVPTNRRWPTCCARTNPFGSTSTN